ncbi:MAG TPA: hypothetical protein VIY98_03475 [Nitrososphaeraceae archaeon]
MRQTYFIILLIVAFTIGITSIILGITLAQEKNETSEIDESMETNNTLSQMANNTSLL